MNTSVRVTALERFINTHATHGVTLTRETVACPLCDCQAKILQGGDLRLFNETQIFGADDAFLGTDLESKVSIEPLYFSDDQRLLPDSQSAEDWEAIRWVETDELVLLRRRSPGARPDALVQEALREVRGEFASMPYLGGCGVRFDDVEKVDFRTELASYRLDLHRLSENLKAFSQDAQENKSELQRIQRDLAGFKAILRLALEE